MMSPRFTDAELREILARGEGQFVEFKSAWDRSSGDRRALKRRHIRDKIAVSVAALANVDGGLLLLGVEDGGEPSGHGYPDEALEDVLAVPARRLRPAVSCRTERLTIDGEEILAFQVPIAAEAVMIEGNGFPCRVGNQIVREPQEVINARKQAYRRVGYEQQYRPQARIEHLDLQLAASFLRKTPVGERPVLELLEYYGLIEKDIRDWRVTNAALLLFARRPAVRWHPKAGLRVFRVNGTERRYEPDRNVTQIGRVCLPLARALEEGKGMVRSQVRRTERLRGLFFEDTPEYPEFAWQEALVNAVGHRDYQDTTRETEIWFCTDRVEIANPGELVPPATLEALFEGLRRGRPIHASRNPILVRVLADAGVMRDEGEGVARIFREMTLNSLSRPTITPDAGSFTITLYNNGPHETSGSD
ncbi:ATP-binding protein [Candidatus Palauibacter sp.]|uniref:ATP-binding protein n=1 Tax=Candidatus Palauibacter sp. TaxID=3101350 RepID=UPI003B02ACD3